MKKVLSLLIAVMMTIGLMTTAAFADGTDVASINGTGYATLAEAVSAASSGDEVKILAAGTYNVPSGKDLTITGTVGGIVFDNIGATNMDGANVTFNNVTFDYYPNTNYTGLQHSGNLTYNDCIINGQVFLYGASEIFTNCTFNQNSADAYNVWTYGAKTVTFNECTFNSVGKSVLVYNEGKAHSTALTVIDTDFIASAPVTGKAAIEIDTSLNTEGSSTVTVDALTTATNFANGSVSGNTLWNDKKDKTNIEVWVDSVQVWPELVAEVNGTGYSTLQAAVNAAEDGAEITVIADHELIWDGDAKFDGYPGLVVVAGKAVTIDLNGKVITVDTDKMSDNRIWAVVAADENGNITMKDSSSEGTGTIKAVGDHAAYCLMMAYEDGTSLTVENGTYYLQNAIDSLLYAGGYTDGMVTVKGGSFELGNIGTGENGKPWTFNVLGAGDHHVSVIGGTFNANVQRQHWANEVMVPETHYVEKTESSTWTVKSDAALYATEDILTGPYYIEDWKIGYSSLEEFFAAADASTTDTIDRYDPITLLQDMTLTASADVSSATFNQNDKIITLAAGISLTSGNDLDVADFRTVRGYKVVETEANGVYTYTSVYDPAANISSSSSNSEPSYQVKNEVEGLKSSHRTAEAGDTVTLTVKDGYDISGIVVTDKNGDEVDVTYKNGKYTFKMPKGGVTITAVDNTDVFQFEDVDEGYWAEDEIYWTYEEGLMNGTTETTFNPAGKVTRQQVWMILARMSGYAPEDMAAAKGWAVSTGVSDGSNPGNAVTRQQLVTLIWRAEGEPEGDISVLAGYPDAASVADYAKEAMAWAIENGVIGGTTQGTLNPAGNATRAQLAAILYRYVD